MSGGDVFSHERGVVDLGRLQVKPAVVLHCAGEEELTIHYLEREAQAQIET